VSTLAGSGERGFVDGPGSSAQFKSPHGLAFDEFEQVVFVCDSENNKLRKITLGGKIQLFYKLIIFTFY
jgi:hypothetical protein